ncbi:conserved hypothetical protein [Gloeothece citriformis PCC 7424]|uniref:Peptidase S1 and S6 chymotrypsin/Hap n=1 Tax=Gloeothece citriformis (strain PCC 7424) TaxID=65393 RepID=B7KH20_GLOC7|nr:serine protease [Gloeothece citriformis]ACK73507.1 conserved hypothetical protein [Gloeothece citriformis PCC 7424]
MLTKFKSKKITSLGLGIILNFLAFPVLTLPPQDIAHQAKKITVKITGSDLEQSGVLLSQDENQYWVLTCTPKQKSAFNKAQIITSDNQSHNILSNQIIELEQFPVTLIPVKVERSYETAILGDSNVIQQGERVYLAGFIQPSRNPEEKLPQFFFTDGIISSVVERLKSSSFTYTNQIYPGMEGNPIFNDQGALIGLYCQNYPIANRQKKDIQLNWGIPIYLLTELAQQKGLTFGFSPFGSPPPSFEP